MSTPPELIQINDDGYDKKDVELIKKLANTLNPFLQQVNQSLSKALTFGQNFQGQVRNVTTTGGQPITLKYEGTGLPTGLILTSVSPVSGSAAIADTIGVPQWYRSSPTEITIHPIKGLATGVKYNISVVILGG